MNAKKLRIKNFFRYILTKQNLTGLFGEKDVFHLHHSSTSDQVRQVSYIQTEMANQILKSDFKRIAQARVQPWNLLVFVILSHKQRLRPLGLTCLFSDELSLVLVDWLEPSKFHLSPTTKK